MGIFIRDNSSWRSVNKLFVNTGSNGWKQVQKGFVNIGSGIWKTFFSSGVTPTIAQEVTISQSTNASSGLITLTGRNYRWTNFSSATYTFEVSTDTINWTVIDTGSIQNPSVGLSNTKTYIIQQSNLTANSTNYFRFSVVVTSSSNNTGTSISTSETVEMPRNITNLSYTDSTYNSGTDNYAINFTWTPSQYSGSQVIQYKQSGSSIWLDWVTVDGSTGSAGVGLLSQNTTYNFRILPWTGTSADGYYGNFSNEISGTTLTSNKPGAPINLSVSNITTNSLTFSWQANPSGGTPDGYIWTYTTNSNTPTGGQYPSNGQSATSTDVTSLSQNTTYYLWVAAFNYYGYSDWSYITALTDTAVITPGTSSISHTKDYSNIRINTSLETFTPSEKSQSWNYLGDVNYNLSWTAATNAISYEIAFNTSNSNSEIVWVSTSNTSYTATWGLLNSFSKTYYYWVRGVSSDGTRGPWSSGTGSTAQLTGSANASIILYRCDSSASTSRTVPLDDLGYYWTGVNTSYTHYAYISATVNSVSVNARSVGCSPTTTTTTTTAAPGTTTTAAPTTTTTAAPTTTTTTTTTTAGTTCSPLQGLGCGYDKPGPGGTTCFYSSVYNCAGDCTGGTLDFCF